MDVLLRQFTRMSLMRTVPSCISSSLLPSLAPTVGKCSFHTTLPDAMPYKRPEGPRKWPIYNKKVWAPQLPGEERRPAFVCHMKTNIKYSPLKMWYVASMIRGMSIDEALKQLTFVDKKGAAIVKDTLLEAQKLAVERHNVEYKSNLWVAESFSTKGVVFKGIRRHAKSRMGLIHWIHCHYFVRLEEGSPPEHFHLDNAPKSTQTHLAEWVAEMRQRRIPGSH